MTLLVSLIAAIIVTILWYTNPTFRKLKGGILIWLFWGASLMWFADAIFEYIELGSDYFNPSSSDMLNDAFLGLSIVVLALIIWIIYMLIKDPLGTIKQELFFNKKSKE